MDEWRSVFGVRLREARLAVPLTQSELAVLLRVAQTAVSAWERGIAIPRDELRPRIAKFVGRTVDELFAYPDNHDEGDNGEAVA
jgi:transcriptional regulator with XRE-family HTH domain